MLVAVCGNNYRGVGSGYTEEIIMISSKIRKRETILTAMVFGTGIKVGSYFPGT